jgi:cobalt-zinc-cadmium resistance protein CzcA
MINWIIEHCLKRRGVMSLLLAVVFVAGFYAYQRMPVDAFPDISPIMVPVFAEAHGMAPEEVERLITYPIESAMNGLPGVTMIKSTSAFGLAVIYVYFEDSVDIYFARQLVAERLAASQSDLPEMDDPPTLGPISTGLGQIFIYYLTLDEGADTQGKDPLLYLRDLNDWIVKFQLQTVPGVTDILSVGGFVMQYQVELDPYAMQAHRISIEDVTEQIQKNNQNAGGQYLLVGSEEHLVRGIGLMQDEEDLRRLAIQEADGTVVRLGDIANVRTGPELRRGVVTRNGGEEVVSGMVLKLYGANASHVIEALYEKVEDVQRGLPEGVHLVPYYEQAHLVANATATVKRALAIGIVLVFLVLLFFLGQLRPAIIVGLAMPFCASIALLAMHMAGISANLMSLGGIAVGLGMLVDGSIVVVENVMRHLGQSGRAPKNKLEVVRVAAEEVGRPITFALIIIVVVFLPIFSLQGVEGKMFHPMAFTTTMALVGSIIAAIVMAPVLSSVLLSGRAVKETLPVRLLKRGYRRILPGILRIRWVVMVAAAVGFILSLVGFQQIGTEFIPTLEEGSVMITATMAPSISLDEAVKTVVKLEERIVKHPDVDEVVSRIGRPEAGSHPHPVNYAEIHIELKPKAVGRTRTAKKELVETLRRQLASYPGVQLNFTQPIQNAFDELLSGIKAQIAIKVFGEDLATIRNTADTIKRSLEGVPGLVDLSAEQSYGQPQVQVIVDRDRAERFGVAADAIMELVETAVGGRAIDTLYMNTRRYDIHLRYAPEFRNSPEDLRQMLVHTDNGSLISLEQVADIVFVEGPVQINRENAMRRWIVQGNVRDRSLGEVVSDIRRTIKEDVALPPGVFIEYGGQFENQQRAMKRLALIVPVAIAAIFMMLWMTFGAPRYAAMVMVNVPLALIGGVAGLMLTGEYLSVPASVGFIALFGISVQDAVVMICDFNDLRNRGSRVYDAVMEGSLIRLRPILMTTLTTLLGLLPLLLSHGPGAEIQRPLAVTVIFGLTSSTILTLVVLPCVYYTFEKRRSGVQQ